jgi:hypothetical protein
VRTILVLLPATPRYERKTAAKCPEEKHPALLQEVHATLTSPEAIPVLLVELRNCVGELLGSVVHDNFFGASYGVEGKDHPEARYEDRSQNDEHQL